MKSKSPLDLIVMEMNLAILKAYSFMETEEELAVLRGFIMARCNEYERDVVSKPKLDEEKLTLLKDIWNREHGKNEM